MEILTQLASQGVLGVIVVVLWNNNREKDKIISDLQEKRVGDAQSTIKGVIDPLGAIKVALDEQKTMFSTLLSMLGKGRND